MQKSLSILLRASAPLRENLVAPHLCASAPLRENCVAPCLCASAPLRENFVVPHLRASAPLRENFVVPHLCASAPLRENHVAPHLPTIALLRATKAFSILLLCCFAFTLKAQTPNEKFVKAMEKALSGMDTLKTAEQWQTASNNFERIAQKETKEWLPAYYVALSQTMIYNLGKDPSKNEALAKKADEYITKADSLNPNNSEIYVLKSMVSGLYIRLNPMVNGMKYGPLSGMQLEKAKSLDAENPRAYMQEGLGAYFTPAQWGGDKEKGKQLMETAAAKFETFKPASSIHPNWGKATNAMFLEMAKKG